MNKRQRKKRDKKQSKTYLIHPMTVEVGDVVQVIGRRYHGHQLGMNCLVIKSDDDDAFFVSKTMDMKDPYAMIHHVDDLKIIRKGGK